jgi:hypothetical protein
MTVAIFAVGIVVFLITVFGTVTVGGLMLTGRQLDGDPQLGTQLLKDNLDDAALRRRAIVNADF